ncbi:50S ribosomal protein L25/general stress protein Ctc [Winogradskyella echinorum]|uniref:Large ribosomal subunit protein bL25 n=1 Tax=Winogradskyella echinorum TaxID=538189 RepID=A0ABR6Y156_9FLAO|nr:50S ribosomal protein L25/general stress protein Ctc [Winogradskyella echinorum]MBC3846005.1 50S ribosomal protein L25/general stress protein Ctc [Winogradskyella echinorum]MBC5750353.1 50S ribosomal protein L25/general stress protein Ctc [Winogradskyella echinorum]
MKSITINGSQRESVGKKSTKALRNAGQVPCVIYGGDKPLHFSAPELAFSKLVYTPNAHTVVITLDNGEKFNAVMQDIQFHPVTDRIIHVDFYQIFENKQITMEIPVKTVGVSKGVLNGGNLRMPYRKLRVKAIPSKLPDFIEIDITPLKIGSKFYITELENDDYKFLHPDNTVVCQVRRSRLAVVDVDEDEDDDEGTTDAGDVPATETDDVAAVKE